MLLKLNILVTNIYFKTKIHNIITWKKWGMITSFNKEKSYIVFHIINEIQECFALYIVNKQGLILLGPGKGAVKGFLQRSDL